MRRLILSGLGSGYLRPAPGTWGSLAALPVAWLLHMLGGPVLLIAAILVAAAVGVPLIRAETAGGEEDPGWIVLDEWAGQWIALVPVSVGAWQVGVDVLALWPGIVAAFLLFRLFDVRKPWLVGRADARGDARGVMEDDLWAGLFAAVVVVILGVLWHVWLLA